ncbi:hypothetical protein R3P38DRAFT_3222099 [Favolaschia claudopus]|uniref:Uncharacterized protein n=1 Tax=Favolaschia claudopus TaxID=2862362 RepID=A0AAV9ZZJ5_9AGAR
MEVTVALSDVVVAKSAMALKATTRGHSCSARDAAFVPIHTRRAPAVREGRRPLRSLQQYFEYALNVKLVDDVPIIVSIPRIRLLAPCMLSVEMVVPTALVGLQAMTQRPTLLMFHSVRLALNSRLLFMSLEGTRVALLWLETSITRAQWFLLTSASLYPAAVAFMPVCQMFSLSKYLFVSMWLCTPTRLTFPLRPRACYDSVIGGRGICSWPVQMDRAAPSWRAQDWRGEWGRMGHWDNWIFCDVAFTLPWIQAVVDHLNTPWESGTCLLPFF